MSDLLRDRQEQTETGPAPDRQPGPCDAQPGPCDPLGRDGDQPAAAAERAPQRGFTLLEVMVALAILAVSLTALLGTQSSSVVLTQYINHVTVATMLAKGKMLDLEHELKKDGFDAFASDHESGNFSDEGHPEFKWDAVIEKIELDESAVQGMMDGAPQSREDVVAKLQENPSLQGMDMSGLNFNPGMIFSFMPTAVQMLGEKVRKCTLTISWKEGTRTRTLAIQTFFVAYEPLTKDPAGTTNEDDAANAGGQGKQQENIPSKPQDLP